MGERRGAYRVLVVKLEERRPLGRPTRRWENNIKMDLHEVEHSTMAGSCECGNEPSSPIKCCKFD